MKKLLALCLAVLFLLTGPALAAPGDALELAVSGMSFQPEWNGESSDTHCYLVIDATLTNWKPEEVNIAKALQAQLRYLDAYEFVAQPVFSTDVVEPLVQLNGALVFRLPNMIAAEPDSIELTLVNEGRSESLALDAKPYALAKSGSFEGPGFDTPEEAVLAFIDAVNNNDPEGAISTFAIETYAEKFNPAAYMERLRAYSISMPMAMPSDDDYTSRLKVTQRYAAVSDSLYYRHLYHSGARIGYDISSMRSFAEEGLIESFIGELSAAIQAVSAQKMEFAEFILPELINPHYTTERNLENIQRNCLSYGGDELTNIAALVKIDGTYYLQCMQCIRYGDRWYNESLGGNVGSLLGMNSYYGGLMPFDLKALAIIEPEFEN